MKRALVLLVGVVVVLLTILPLINSTFFQLHDVTHVARLAEMHRALLDGQFPVRWSQNFGYGYGMPLFNFYGPAPYYLAETFHWAGFSSLVSIKLLLVAIAVFSFVGMYLLSSRWFGRLGGLVSAVMFTVFPYRALDIYVRGAFNEIFAVTLIPWIFYAMVRIRELKERKWIGVLALLLMVFLATHNLMTMMFLPIIYVFGWVLFVGSSHKKKYFLWFHLSLLLGVLAAAFFLFPAYLEKGYTQVDALLGGYSNYKFHFLYVRQLFTGIWGYGGSILGLEDGLSFSLGVVQFLLAGVGAAYWFLRTRKTHRNIFPIFFVLISGATLFMTTLKSQFIWDQIPLFAYFQFPWRFLSVPAVTLPILAGGVVYALNQRRRVLYTFIILVALCVVNLQYFRPQSYLEDPETLYYENPTKIQSDLSGILPDYIPTAMKETQKPFQPVFEFVGESSPIETLIDRSQEKLAHVVLVKPQTMTIRIAWFPNWVVYDNTEKADYTIEDKTGFMLVKIPQGEHWISVRLEDTPLRTASNLLSLLGLLSIAGVFLYDRH